MFKVFKDLAETSVNVALNYLKFYGYLDENVDEDTLVNAVRKFQEFFDLVPDGVLGPRTFRAMQTPRCACKDILTVEELNATQRKWRKVEQGKPLVVNVTKFVSSLNQNDQLRAIDRALNSWAKHTPINFQLVVGQKQGDINVSAGRGRRNGFDGPSGTLAWAELPPGNDRPLQLMMDDDETFIVGNGRGILFENVFCHELGHNLGLNHSQVKEALMAPYYSPNIWEPLSDDIKRVQAYYGRRVEPTPQPQPQPQPPSKSNGQIVINLSGNIDHIEIPGYRVIKLA